MTLDYFRLQVSCALRHLLNPDSDQGRDLGESCFDFLSIHVTASQRLENEGQLRKGGIRRWGVGIYTSRAPCMGAEM